MTEVFIAFTHDGLPNQKLGRVDVGQFIRCGAVLGHPGGVDIAVVAVLQNPANQRLDGVGIDGLVERGRVVVPKGFVLRRKGMGVVDGSPRLDTIGHLSLIGADGESGEHIIGFHIPAIHELEIVPIPMVAVAFRVTGEAHHIDLRALSRSLGGSAETDEHGKAHEQSHEQCHAFPLYSRCHILSFSAHLGNKKSAPWFHSALGVSVLFCFYAYPI